jgi:hypothetical protein
LSDDLLKSKATIEAIIRNIDEAILKRSVSDISSIEIKTNLGSRSFEKQNLNDLIKTRTYYVGELEKVEEKIKNLEGRGKSRMVLVSF